MPIKSTSENPESKFWPIPGPTALNYRSIVLTLSASATLAFLFVLAVYARRGGDLGSRIEFGLFVSALPFLIALGFIRLTRLVMPWYGVATLYLLIFFLVAIIQNYGR